MRKFIIFLILGAIFLPLFSTLASFDASTAKEYLLARANNPWITIGLAALGASSIPSDYLKSVSGSTAIEYAAPILAITSLNQDPQSFGGKDYIAELKKYFINGQIGDPANINDDIFGVLALVSAGLPTSDSVLAGAKNFILANQQANGGWGFSVNGGTDSNMTAAAIVALIASKVSVSDDSIQKGFEYLKTAQNNDGGFTYDPQSQFGTDSDSSSTAWVLWALNAAAINQSDWIKSGNTPSAYLESNQAAAGYFKYQANSLEDSFSGVTTAYAVIALSGKTLPLNRVSNTSSSKYPFRIEGKDNTVCSGETEGPTALDVVKNASVLCGFSYHIQTTSFGPYLDQIRNDTASGSVGWLYLVNFVSPSVGAGDYVLKTNDTVLWYFGDFNWKPTRLSLSNLEVASGEKSVATVEYLEGNNWVSLPDASIAFGASNVTTDQTGKANITAADGYSKVFAQKDGYVRSNSLLLKIGNPTGNSVNLSVNIQKGKIEGSTVSFEINPSIIDFGTVKPGQSNSQTLVLTNIGDVNIFVQGTVNGDEVFISNLLLNSSSWKNFEKQIVSKASQNINATLNIPTNYSGTQGVKSGNITFWAIAE